MSTTPRAPVRSLGVGDLRELERMRIALWPDSTRAEAAGAARQHLEGELFILVVERLPTDPPTVGRPDRSAADAPPLCAFAEASVRPHAEGCVSAPVAYLEGIWVDPDVRRGGVAHALVEGIAAWARERGLTELASDTEVENDASRRFHAAAGFEDVGAVVCFRREI